MTASSPPAPLSLCINWIPSTISGYGNYALQIMQQFLRQGGQQIILPRKPAITEVPPMVQHKLAPFFSLSEKLENFMKENVGEKLAFKHAVLHGCSGNFAGFPWQDKAWGQPNVACCAIEHLILTEHGRSIATNYDMYIAISQWNYDYLKSLDLGGPVHLCYQGIDRTIFHPAPSTGLYGDRFVVFTGGKFEFRKGQDIVVAAFKRFYERHKDALLVTCWQNLIKASASGFDEAGYIKGIPEPGREYGLDLTPWLLKQGLPAESFIDLPFTQNLLMPWVLRECDVAIFPNRCEGGTNLVAMEAMACGVPTFVSYNTGQKDLVDLIGCGAFRQQKPVKPGVATNSVEDWGETDVDEVVEKLEQVYTQHKTAKENAAIINHKLDDWQWGPLNKKLLDIVLEEKDSL